MKFVICNLKFLRKLLVKFQIVVSNGLNSQKIVDLQKSFSSQKVQRKLTIIPFKPAASSTYDSHHRGKFVPRLPQRFGRLARRMDELFRGYRFRRTVTYWISRVRQCQQWALNGSAEQTHNCFNPLELRCIDLVTNINLIFDFPTTNVHSYLTLHY